MPSKYFAFLTALLFLSCIQSRSQELVQTESVKKCSWSEFVGMYMEDIGEGDDFSERYMEERLENLRNIYDQPIDVNTATRERLLEISFLTDSQADSIVSYVARYGPLVSYGELSLIPGLDYRTRYYLTAFLTVSESILPKNSVGKMISGGVHKVSSDVKIPFNTPVGYTRKGSLSESSRYLGDKERVGMKYSYNYQRELRWGFNTEKDAGEPFASRGNDLMDSYSFYIVRSQREGKYTVLLGDYKINFGQGLLVGNNFIRSKCAYLDGRASHSSVTPHTSYSERDFFRGFAGRVMLGKFFVTAFFSIKYDDTSLSDSGKVTALYTGGYHRTQTEMKRRNSVTDLTGGTDVSFRTSRCEIGIAGYYLNYSKELAPAQTVYNRYAMRGRDFGGGSLHYTLNAGRIHLAGEGAVSEKGAPAFYNSLRWEISDHLILTSVIRSYSKRYNAVYGDGFSSGSRISNEQGVLLGAGGAFRRLSYNVYFDLYRCPWPKYNFRSTQDAGEIYTSATYSFDRENSMSLFCKFRRKVNENAAGDSLSQSRLNMKLRGTYSLAGIKMTSGLLFSSYSARGRSYRGFGVGQRFDFSLADILKSVISFTYFSTDNYDTRIYSYDGSLGNIFDSFVPLSGKGFRTSLLITRKFLRRLRVGLRYGFTKYFDRDEVGTGAGRIESSMISSLSVSASFIF